MNIQNKLSTLIKISKTNPNAIIPCYQTSGSAGMDLHACLTGSIILKPSQRVLIKTGICINLEEGYEAQVRSRSGLANKFGVCVLNSPGTIDSDYRGEIGVILINLGEEDFIINDKDRIAQLIIAKYSQIEWLEVDKLNTTTRGDAGFGSTGV